MLGPLREAYGVPSAMGTERGARSHARRPRRCLPDWCLDTCQTAHLRGCSDGAETGQLVATGMGIRTHARSVISEGVWRVRRQVNWCPHNGYPDTHQIGHLRRTATGESVVSELVRRIALIRYPE